MKQEKQTAPSNTPTQSLWKTHFQVLTCTGTGHSRYFITWIVPGCNKNKSFNSPALSAFKDEQGYCQSGGKHQDPGEDVFVDLPLPCRGL